MKKLMEGDEVLVVNNCGGANIMDIGKILTLVKYNYDVNIGRFINNQDVRDTEIYYLSPKEYKLRERLV